MTDKYLLPAERGIGGNGARERLPGRVIEERPSDAAKRAANQAEKLRLAQEAEGGSNGR